MNRRLVTEAFYLFVKTYTDYIEFRVSQKCRIQKEGRGSFLKDLDLFASRDITFIFMKGVCFL